MKTVEQIIREQEEKTGRRASVQGRESLMERIYVPAPPKSTMNGLETRYAEHLERRRMAGEISWWAFGSIRLKLADGAWYKPDFAAMFPDQSWIYYETKGFFREAANVRLKVAAEKYPVPFVIVREVGGAWEYETVGGTEGL